MSERGKLIVLEGIDGCGKTTQTKKLAERFKMLRIPRLATREHWPEDVLGEAIHKVVDQKSCKLSPTALQLTFIANRVNHTESLIVPTLDDGKLVISDRYSLSTLAYAGESDLNMLTDLTEMLRKAGKILTPDLTILIDVPVDVVISRLSDREERSIFEEKEKLNRARERYLSFFGDDKTGRMVSVDGSFPEMSVHELIFGEIQRRGMV